MDSSIVQRCHRWTLSEPDGLNYDELLGQIAFRTESYDEYHPSIGPFPKFRGRLLEWIDSTSNSNEEDQKTMLRMVPEILYLGRGEFISLYRTAFHELIIPWLIERQGSSITDADIKNKVEEGIKKTWFCPLTDSMHISDFYHVNNITGIEYRPDWLSLDQFADVNKIEEYMNSHELSYLVLLEDFIGSGDQVNHCIEFAAKLRSQFQILVIPLVICAEGLREGKSFERTYKNLTFEPVMTIAETDLVGLNAKQNESELFTLIRDVCKRLEPKLHWRYGAFGFHDTGALLVMYTNCPDNTLSLIHDKSKGEWNPLFPRSTRI